MTVVQIQDRDFTLSNNDIKIMKTWLPDDYEHWLNESYFTERFSKNDLVPSLEHLCNVGLLIKMCFPEKTGDWYQPTEEGVKWLQEFFVRVAGIEDGVVQFIDEDWYASDWENDQEIAAKPGFRTHKECPPEVKVGWWYENGKYRPNPETPVEQMARRHKENPEDKKGALSE